MEVLGPHCFARRPGGFKGGGCSRIESSIWELPGIADHVDERIAQLFDDGAVECSQVRKPTVAPRGVRSGN